jgi:hypothetical protein
MADETRLAQSKMPLSRHQRIEKLALGASLTLA